MPIEITKSDGVAIVTIAQPARKNAITLEMRREFARGMRDLAEDDMIRAVVLRGGGSDFSAGADIGEMGGDGVDGALSRMRLLREMVLSLAECGKPVIAAVQGVCVGMSFGLALACDFIVAADDARFQLSFRHIGLAMDAATGWLLERHIGVMRAKEIAYSGRFVSGIEAVELGFALEAMPTASVEGQAIKLAKGFVDAAPLALAQMKRQFHAYPRQSLADALDSEMATQTLMIGTSDFREAVDSFKKKRSPKFSGS